MKYFSCFTAIPDFDSVTNNLLVEWMVQRSRFCRVPPLHVDFRMIYMTRVDNQLISKIKIVGELHACRQSIKLVSQRRFLCIRYCRRGSIILTTAPPFLSMTENTNRLNSTNCRGRRMRHWWRKTNRIYVDTSDAWLGVFPKKTYCFITYSNLNNRRPLNLERRSTLLRLLLILWPKQQS